MTGPAARLPTRPSRLHRPRPTARLRLTLLYGTLLTLAGAALLGFTFWLFDRGTNDGKRILPQAPPGRGIACLRSDHRCTQIARAWMLQHRFDLHTLLAQSSIALAVMAVLAFALGWLVAGRVLRPVRAITATARAISATSLHERLTVTGPDDEFSELAGTLNDLLARLEASFTAQRHFVANASHELRTPLTLDRTLLQLALRDPGTTTEQWRATGAELLQSGVHQAHLLEALLTLATGETGITSPEPADLSEAAAASLHATRPEAGRQQLHVQTSLDSAPLLGDPGLIERLALNLLDNAIRHTTMGGTVQLSTGQQDGHAVISVANTGPVIPSAEVTRLFRPFERLATSRASNGHGHGLGLSIVAAIADAHHATIDAHAQPEGGLLVRVSFPGQPPDTIRAEFDHMPSDGEGLRMSNHRATALGWQAVPRREAAVTTGPADENTAAVARGRLRASHADREHVIGTLKAAFVQGRLTKDELDLRIGQTFAARTYAELARLTVDIPAALIAASAPRKAARSGARLPMSNAAKSGISVAIAVVTLVLTAYLTDGQALFVFVPFYSVALLVALAQVLDSRHQKRSRGQLPPRAAQ